MAACGELELEIKIATSELGIEIANLRARRVLRRLRVCAGGGRGHRRRRLVARPVRRARLPGAASGRIGGGIERRVERHGTAVSSAHGVRRRP